mmetsp:Transcript_54647/g.143920  ORF Transcript_54647/g.143920 Transcript_54647/m.143920 type:complete len:284 (+) Transcript_54647:750-1601(+)
MPVALLRVRGRRWRHVVEDADALIAGHQKERLLPERLVPSQRVVDVGDELLAVEHVVGRVHVVRRRAVQLALQVLRLDPREGRQQALLAEAREVPVGVGPLQAARRLQPLVEHDRQGKVAIEHAPLHVVMQQAVEHRLVVELHGAHHRLHRVHLVMVVRLAMVAEVVDVAVAVAVGREEPVRPRLAGRGGEVGVRDAEVVGQLREDAHLLRAEDVHCRRPPALEVRPVGPDVAQLLGVVHLALVVLLREAAERDLVVRARVPVLVEAPVEQLEFLRGVAVGHA